MAKSEPQLRAEREQGLFMKYEWHAKYSGDDAPKKAVASAKRTATSLNGTAETFGRLHRAYKQATTSSEEELRT